MKNRITQAFAIVTAIVVSPLMASAQPVPVFDPANFATNKITASASIKSSIQNALQVINSAKQLIAEVDSYKLQLQNMRDLPSQVWSDVEANLRNARNLTAVEHNIGIMDDNLDTRFQDQYPGYQPNKPYHEIYRTWDTNTQQAARQLLKVAHQYESERATQSAVTARNGAAIRSATGALAIAKASGTIAAQTVEQLGKLQSIENYRAQNEALYYLKANGAATHAEQQDAAFQKWMKTADPSSAPNILGH